MRILMLLPALVLARSTGLEAVPADSELVAVVDRRVRAWQPSAEERRFDEIGWAPTIGEAKRLAGESRRPIFYFTHDGHMAVGRC